MIYMILHDFWAFFLMSGHVFEKDCYCQAATHMERHTHGVPHSWSTDFQVGLGVVRRSRLAFSKNVLPRARVRYFFPFSPPRCWA
jgi:hypothetical protein